jgi:DNA-binding XRE family transcriptional regulator
MFINYSNIIRNMKRIRQETGLSQQKVAQGLGVTKATISLIESGKLLPSLDIIPNIPRALGCHTIEIHAFDPETVSVFEDITERVRGSYDIVIPDEHILSAVAVDLGDTQSLSERSMNIFFRIDFLNKLLNFFSWISQESNQQMFGKKKPVARDIANFLGSLPEKILKDAIGNRKLSAVETDENTGQIRLYYFEDEKCLDLKEDPPLEGIYIAPVIGIHLGFDIIPKNRLELYLDEITDILRNRPDLVPLLYVTIKKLSAASRIDQKDIHDLKPIEEKAADKLFLEHKVGISKSFVIEPRPRR